MTKERYCDLLNKLQTQLALVFHNDSLYKVPYQLDIINEIIKIQHGLKKINY